MSNNENKKMLSFSDTLGLCIGQIIGSGIMVLTGVVIGTTGHGTPLAFICAAIMVIISMLPYAVMTSAIPASGAGYAYVKRLCGDKAAFMYLLSFVLTQILIATFALGFASYFVAIFPSFNETFVAIFVVILCMVINLIGVKTTALAQKIMVVILLLALALFIVFGLPQVEWSYLVLTTENMMPNGFKAFLVGCTLLSFACNGAKFVSENADIIVNPGKTIPTAMVFSTVLVAIFYAFIGIVAAGVLPLEQVAYQNLTAVAQQIFPPAVYIFFIVGGAMFGLLTTLNGTLSWVTRGLQAAAKEGWLPESFAKENKGGAPVKLLIIFAIVAIAPIALGMDTEAVATLGIGLSCLVDFWLLYCMYKLPKACPKEYEAAPFRFKSIKVHYVVLGLSFIITLGSAYVNLSDLTLITYGAVAIYLLLAFALTNYRYKFVLAQREATKVK